MLIFAMPQAFHDGKYTTKTGLNADHVRNDVRKGAIKTKKPPVGGFTTLLIALIILCFPMVPGVGLEPTQRERRGILNPLCLPIPPSGLGKKVEARSGVEPD